MGPYAGLELVKNIFDHTLADTDQAHLDVLLLSLPASIADRTEYLLGKNPENPGIQIAEVIRRLEEAGATVVGIPCNTAHADEIFTVTTQNLRQMGSAIRVLSLIDAAVNSVLARFPAISRIGVLSTTGTQRVGIYTRALKNAGLQVIEIDAGMQDESIHPAIVDAVYGIKAQSNPVTARARQDLLSGIRQLKSQGAELVIKGCTEINLAIPETEIEGMPLIDPSVCLARALIEAVNPQKLRPLPAADAPGLMDAPG